MILDLPDEYKTRERTSKAGGKKPLSFIKGKQMVLQTIWIPGIQFQVRPLGNQSGRLGGRGGSTAGVAVQRGLGSDNKGSGRIQDPKTCICSTAHPSTFAKPAATGEDDRC